MKKLFPQIVITLLLFCSIVASSQQTIGLIQHDPGGFDDGYVLFAPMSYKKTYLIDKCGKEIHSWPSAYRPGLAVYLLEDGNLLRTGCVNDSLFTGGGTGGIIEKIDWNGTVLWSYRISDQSTQCQHHDIQALPNGNVLAIVWELKTRAEAIAAGRDTTLLGQNVWSEKIVELQPVGFDSANIVWEWHIWDHLVQDHDSTKANFGVVASNPRLMNINFRATASSSDWLHFNSIDYNPDLDQILITIHNFGEIFIIDHSTTTAEAASHSGGYSNRGGDLLYRWGNAASYNSGTTLDTKLWGPHNAQWIVDGCPDAGKILIFNNRHPLASFNYSSVEIIDPPVNSAGAYVSPLPYLPDSSLWSYWDSVPGNFNATFISGAQELSNGNVLICNGPIGHFFEVEHSKNKVWEYINPVKSNGPMTQGNPNPNSNSVFRCTFYPTNYSGFNNHILTPGLPIELNPYPYTCILDITTGVNEMNIEENEISIYPNPANDQLSIVLNEKIKIKNIELINSLGQTILTTQNTLIDLSEITAGLYLVKITTTNGDKITTRVIKN